MNQRRRQLYVVAGLLVAAAVSLGVGGWASYQYYQRASQQEEYEAIWKAQLKRADRLGVPTRFGDGKSVFERFIDHDDPEARLAGARLHHAHELSSVILKDVDNLSLLPYVGHARLELASTVPEARRRQIDSLLSKAAPLFVLADQVVNAPRIEFRSPVQIFDYDHDGQPDLAGLEMEQLRTLRRWYSLQVLHATLDEDLEKLDRSIRAMFRLIEHASDRPIVVSPLMVAALASATTSALEQAISRMEIPAEHLKFYRAQLESIEPLLDFERAAYLTAIRAAHDAANHDKIMAQAFARQLAIARHSERFRDPDEDPPRLTETWEWENTSIWPSDDSVPIPAEQVEAMVWDRLHEHLRRDGKWKLELATSLMNALNEYEAIKTQPIHAVLQEHRTTRLADIWASSLAQLRTTRIGLAFEIYRIEKGHWPAGLHALASPVPLDPYSGQPFHVIQHPHRLVIYSYGEDGEDDQGEWEGGRRAQHDNLDDEAFTLFDPGVRNRLQPTAEPRTD